MAYKQNYFDFRKTLLIRGATLAAAVLFSSVSFAIEPGQYYRYVNDDGVKVISHSIPPEYAQKGYEIISRTGQVLKSVAAAPDPIKAKEEKAKLEKERTLMAAYEVLARRYSSEKEIFAARDRRLAHLNANIAILNSNINNLKNQVEELMSRAAGYERGGRAVPPAVLKSLKETRAEISTTNEMLQSRIEEHDAIHQEFEEAAALYRKGKEIAASTAEK